LLKKNLLPPCAFCKFSGNKKTRPGITPNRVFIAQNRY
jgi:hypothetical protein